MHYITPIRLSVFTMRCGLIIQEQKAAESLKLVETFHCAIMSLKDEKSRLLHLNSSGTKAKYATTDLSKLMNLL